MNCSVLPVLMMCFMLVIGEETQPDDETQGSHFQNRYYRETAPQNLIDPCKTASTSGIYKIQQLNQNVYCEMTTFGGGWMVFQQRASPFSLDFNRYWAEYRAGFGTVGKNSEFWLGLEALHRLTSSDEYELAVELKAENGTYGYARYSQFRIAGEADKYRLTVGGYSGIVRDDLGEQNNMQFSTRDSDNDDSVEYSCARNWWDGGWWYNQCGCAPNYSTGPYWSNFAIYGTYSRIMIRQKQ